jgi:hypothetical protein
VLPFVFGIAVVSLLADFASQCDYLSGHKFVILWIYLYKLLFEFFPFAFIRPDGRPSGRLIR